MQRSRARSLRAVMVHCYTCFPHVHVVSRVFEVVIGGTRMESGFCHSWWDSHGVQILSFHLPLWSPQFGKGLVHLVLCVVERLLVV